MRRFTSSGEPSDVRKRNTAAQWSVYVMLLAMSATDIMRAPSSALRAHADGIGEGFSSFRYGELPSLHHLVARASITDQFAATSAEANPDEQEGGHFEEGPSDAFEAEHEPTEASDDCYMEIEDEPSVPLSTPTAAFAVSLLAGQSRMAGKSRFNAMSLTIIETMLEFLPLQDINRVRHLSLRLGMAATRICPQPLGEGITFVRSTGLTSLAVPLPNPHAPPTPFVWRCVNCSGYSNYHEACVNCNTNIRVSACRVFLGQVRKQHTAEAIRCILKVLAPQVDVLHIESHSNKDGYEKGAAWVYVDNADQAHAVTQLHKRVFFDCDNDGGEGFWFIDEARDELHLEEFAGRRKLDDQRKHRPLPGQPLVAEFPTTSMLRGFKPQPLHAAAVHSRQNRPYNGWYQQQ